MQNRMIQNFCEKLVEGKKDLGIEGHGKKMKQSQYIYSQSLQNIFELEMFPKTIQTRQSRNAKEVGSFSYALEDVLGKGNQATVYKGKHLDKNYEIAIKVINTQTMNNGIEKKLLDSEIKMLELVRSKPYILNLHEVIKTYDEIYIVTELCYGDLSQRLKDKMSETQAWKYLNEIIKGFRYLHENHIIHRDLKPANLLFNAKDQIKIADFGFAINQVEARKQNLYNIGSPEYMAPQVLRKNQYSFKSDIWAIGMIFYEMLTGHRPWKNRKQEFIDSRLTENFIKRLLKSHNFSSKIHTFLSQCLRVDPDERMSPQQLFVFDTDFVQSIPLRINKSQTIVNNEVDRNPEEKKIPTETMRKPYSVKKDIEKRIFIKKKILPQEELKTKKNKSVMIEKPSICEIGSISENLMFRINSCEALFSILTKISLNDGIKAFIKKRCRQQVNVLCICYSNIIIRMLLKIIDLQTNNFLFIPKNHLLNYVKTAQYGKIMKICQEMINKYSVSVELKEHWPRARDQNVMGAINATKIAIKKIIEEIKFYNYQQIKLLKSFINVMPLLESIHHEKMDKQNLQIFLETESPKNSKNQEDFIKLIQRGKFVSEQLGK